MRRLPDRQTGQVAAPGLLVDRGDSLRLLLRAFLIKVNGNSCFLKLINRFLPAKNTPEPFAPQLDRFGKACPVQHGQLRGHRGVAVVPGSFCDIDVQGFAPATEPRWRRWSRPPCPPRSNRSCRCPTPEAYVNNPPGLQPGWSRSRDCISS